jgi:hypothetical protein
MGGIVGPGASVAGQAADTTAGVVAGKAQAGIATAGAVANADTARDTNNSMTAAKQSMDLNEAVNNIAKGIGSGAKGASQ